MRYWRVTFLAGNGKPRSVWATNYRDAGAGERVTFFVVDRYGDEGEPRELVVAAQRDIARLRPALFSKKYGWLEVGR